MINAIIYIFPMVMNIITGTIFFAVPMRAVENGATTSMVSLIFTTYGIGYVIFCLSMSKIVKVRLAKMQMVVSSLLMTLLLFCLAFFESNMVALVVFGLFPFGTAMFFNAFQAFMKDVDSGRSRPLTYSVGFYFASVSVGFALGPFVSGWMREYSSWTGSFILVALMALAVALASYWFKPEHNKEAVEPDRTFIDKPDLALSGWIGALFGSLALSLWLTMFPQLCEHFGFRPGIRGMLLFIQHIFQAGVALALIRSRTWIFHPIKAPYYNLFGMAALAIAYFAGKPGFLVPASLFFGAFSAHFFFTAIFHSLSHPSKSVRNIAINEAAIGVGFFAGPQLVNLVSQGWDFRAPYLMAGAGLLVVIVFQYTIVNLKTRKA